MYGRNRLYVAVVEIPVDALQVGIDQFLLELSPAVVKDIRLFGGIIQHHLGIYADRLGLAAFGIHLYGFAVSQHENEFSVRRKFHRGVPGAEFIEELCFFRSQLRDPQVVAFFEARQIKKLLAIFGKYPVGRG